MNVFLALGVPVAVGLAVFALLRPRVRGALGAAVVVQAMVAVIIAFAMLGNAGELRELLFIDTVAAVGAAAGFALMHAVLGISIIGAVEARHVRRSRGRLSAID